MTARLAIRMHRTGSWRTRTLEYWTHLEQHPRHRCSRRRWAHRPSGPALRAVGTTSSKPQHGHAAFTVWRRGCDFSTTRRISSLQAGATPGRETGPQTQQQNCSPPTRLISGVGGSLLTLYGLRRSGLTKPLLSTAGLIITARSVTNMDTRSLLGVGGEIYKSEEGYQHRCTD